MLFASTECRKDRNNTSIFIIPKIIFSTNDSNLLLGVAAKQRAPLPVRLYVFSIIDLFIDPHNLHNKANIYYQRLLLFAFVAIFRTEGDAKAPTTKSGVATPAVTQRQHCNWLKTNRREFFNGHLDAPCY